MTFRFTPFALAALLAIGVGCGDGGSSASSADTAEMTEFETVAYAAGFRAAQGLKGDSALFAFFEYGTFEEGFNAGLEQDSSRLAFLVGYEIGSQIGRDTTSNIDSDRFLAGFRFGLDNDSLGIPEEELERVSQFVQDSLSMQELRRVAQTDTSAAAFLRQMQDNEAAARRFIAEVEGREGVTKTASGLLYTVEEEGTGETVAADDAVSVIYTGRLEDGTVFDSSEGEPATFLLSGVVDGFQEGLTGMKVGGKRTLYIPPALGYGRGGGGPVPPNAALVFDVEVVAIADAPPPQPQLVLPGQ